MATASNIEFIFFNKTTPYINTGNPIGGYDNSISTPFTLRIGFTLDQPALSVEVKIQTYSYNNQSRAGMLSYAVSTDPNDMRFINYVGTDNAQGSTGWTGKWTSGSITLKNLTAGRYYLYIWASTTELSRVNFYQSASVNYEPGAASSISAPDGFFGSIIPITISRFDSTYTHTITASCAGITETILNEGSTYPKVNWMPAVATYAPGITNSMQANCLLTCITYYNGIEMGRTTVNITLSFKPDNVKPSTSISVEDATGCLAKYGKYVVTKSKLKISLTDTLKYGASTKAVSITANGATYSTNPATTNELLSESYNTIKAKIQDSRSLWSDEASVTLNILPYAPPSISSFSVHRCDADGTANDEGAYCRVDFDVSISPLDNINSKALTVKYKAVRAEEYASDSISLAAYAATGSYVFAADTEQSFDVSLELADDFSTTVIQTRLSTASTMMAFRPGGLGVGFGKVPEYDHSFEIAADWTLRIGERTLLDLLHPIGSVYISSKPTDPGTLFGGTWTRIKDTFILAAGDTYAAGATGGAAQITQTVEQMPLHGHQVCIGEANNAARLVWSAGEGSQDQNAWGFSYGSPSEYGNYVNAVGTGESQPMSIMPPYITRYVWERTA